MVLNKKIWKGAIALFVVIALSACSEPADVTVEETETPVAVAKAFSGSLTGNNEFTGMTKASSDIEVIPKAAGQLTQVNVSVGDTVSAGQVLAVIDNKDQQTALENDQTQLTRAQNGLERAINGKNQAQINYENAKINIEQIERQIQETEKNLERMKSLFDEGLISQKEVEDVELALFNQQKQLEQAKLNLQVSEANLRDIDNSIKDAEIAVQQANLAVESSQRRLADTQIVAPTSGVIASIEADVGEMVSSQAPFARIVSVDVIDVEIRVTAEQLMLFEKGDTVEVQVTGLADPFEGKVTDIAPAADDTGLFTVTVQVANPDRLIKPGMIAQVIIEEILTEESVIVPTEAVLERLDTTYVFVVVDGVAYQRNVEVIRYDTEYTAIKGDVQPDDVVVIKGQTLIKNEDKVRIVEEGN